MTVAADERLRWPEAAGGADAVTVSFADPERDVYGLARLGVAAAQDGLTGSALVVLFHGREPVGAVAHGGLELAADVDWADLAAGGLQHTIVAPLHRWTVAWDGDGQGFALELEAVCAPAEVGEDSAVTAAGGLAGYEQLVRVTGTMRVGTETLRVDGLGQRSRAWGVSDWKTLDRVRTLSAWFGEDRGGIVLQALRPGGAEHDGEALWAAIVDGGEPVPVVDARVSTTYDGDGHQRRAGLELWVDAEAGAVRAAGEVLCGSSIELGALRLDLAFMRWHADGAVGVGRYDVLRKP